jgi:transposase
MVSAFEGDEAETKTMLPVIEAFMPAHDLSDVTIVADAGMVSEANQKAIEAAGLSFIPGMRIPHNPYAVKQRAASTRTSISRTGTSSIASPSLDGTGSQSLRPPSQAHERSRLR